jgi:hypothetical protein
MRGSGHVKSRFSDQKLEVRADALVGITSSGVTLDVTSRCRDPVPMKLGAVTFDCWNTLLYEANWDQAHA